MDRSYVGGQRAEHHRLLARRHARCVHGIAKLRDVNRFDRRDIHHERVIGVDDGRMTRDRKDERCREPNKSYGSTDVLSDARESTIATAMVLLVSTRRN